MHVIATAGHVDHGKSTLVRALTGTDPDRLAEERRRGMTIDLGFAWTRLGSVGELAFVDVPGHERFITNMLAGVGPVPVVLLVVAADSGWSAQTEEHVRALDALAVRHGVVAVTKTDLCHPGRAMEAARGRLRTTSLSDARCVPVSAATGDGLAGLQAEIERTITAIAAPEPRARVRLWVDRCFTIRGSGTVATGTLQAGTLRRGDELQLGERVATVRALQCLGRPVETVSAIARVALNLRGAATHELHRGDALLTPGAWRSTRDVDVRLEGEVPARVHAHIGAAAVPGVVRRLDTDSRTGPARLRLAAPLPLQVGDRLLLRDPGRHDRLAGAVVLDPLPPPLVRRGSARRRAVELTDDDGRPDLARELARRGAVEAEMLRALGVTVPELLPDSCVASGGWLIARDLWERWRRRATDVVRRRREGALRDNGIAIAELTAMLQLPDPRLVDDLIDACPELERRDGRVRDRASSTGLRPDLAAALERVSRPLRTHPFEAPEQGQLVAAGLGARELGAAAAAGVILRLPGDVVLLPDAPTLAVERLRTLAAAFTLSEARQALGTTRRVAVPLLEHLDAIRATERSADGLRRLRA